MTNKSLFLEKNALKLHYKVTGTGKPLILLNSAFADLRVWSYVEERLSQDYKLIQLDFRYTGQTEQDGSDYTMYEDLNDLIDELGLSKVNLIGLSAGSHTALEYAIKYPEKVDKICLISAGLFGLKEDDNKVKRMKTFETALYSGHIEEAVDIWTKTWLIGEKREEEDLSPDKIKLFKEITRASLEKSSNFKMPLFLKPPVNDCLDQIENQVFHIIGRFDYEDVYQSSDLFKDKIKNYKQKEVSGGHIIPLDLPDLLVEMIIKFIN